MTTATPPVDMRGAHTPHHLRGSHGRLRHRLLIYFAGSLAVIIGLGALGSVLGGPKQHLCRPYQPCGVPKAERPLVNETVWRSSKYGFTLEYPGDALSIVRQDSAGVLLGLHLLNGHTAAIVVQGFSRASRAQAIRNQIAGLSGITQVATDTLSGDQLLGPDVGNRAGVGGVYTGFLAAPQGVGNQISMYSEAAEHGGITVSVTALAASSDSGTHSAPAFFGDVVSNSIRWPHQGGLQ
jgi:hypothetical protein